MAVKKVEIKYFTEWTPQSTLHHSASSANMECAIPSLTLYATYA